MILSNTVLIYGLLFVLILISLLPIKVITTNISEAFLNKSYTNHLRGIAILFVVASHYAANIYKAVHPSFSLPEYLISHFCALGVGFFFFCSGYGNFFSVAKCKNKLRWLLNHSAKIFICVAILLILQFIIVKNFGLISFEMQNIFSLIRHIFTITISPWTMWFIKELIFMYLIIYISEIIICDRQKKLLFIIISMLLYTLFFLITKNNSSFWWKSTLCFPLGYLCAYYKDSIIEYLSKYKKYCLIIIFLITMFLSILNLCSFFDFINIYIFIFESIFAMILLSILSTYINFQSKILNFCGKYSLEIYTTHLFLLSFLIKLSHLNLFLLLIVLLGVTLLIVKPLNFCILKTKYILDYIYDLITKKGNLNA